MYNLINSLCLVWWGKGGRIFLMYQLNKQYYLDGSYYICILLTKSYATLQKVGSSKTIMVRGSNLI